MNREDSKPLQGRLLCFQKQQEATILQTIERTARKYTLFRDTPVVLAYSGGKDSIVAADALRGLGVPFVPVTVDMGYSQLFAERVINLARSQGTTLTVLGARESNAIQAPMRSEINRRLELLQGPSKQTASPCTHCYSVKLIKICEFAIAQGLRTIVFAHHETDALSSLIKEALFYIDVHVRGHVVFQRENYLGLIEELSKDLRMKRVDGLAADLITVIRTADLTTDEPPRQDVSIFPDLEIVRPMFELSEDNIRFVIESIETDLRPESSGCGHTLSRATQTPRELVQYQALAGITKNVRDVFVQAMQSSLRPDGSVHERSRLRRAARLGPGYRPVEKSLDKR